MSADSAGGRRRTASPQTHLAIDWVAHHGNVSAPLAMATTAGAVASMGAWAGMPSGWPLLVGVAGAAAHGVGVGVRRRLSRPSLAARSAGWLLAGGWSSTVIATDPTTWTATGWWSALGSLTAIALGVGAGLYRADVHEEALDDSRRAMEAAMIEAEISRQDWEVIDRWVSLIKQVTRVQVTPVGYTPREDASGFELEIRLPVGAPSTRFSPFAKSIAEAAGLPPGCLVSVGDGSVQGNLLLGVDTLSPARRSSVYPMDAVAGAPLTVNGPLPWGVQRTGAPIEVMMREACALIIGPPGSGKTTLLDCILTAFNRCSDVLVWGVDTGKSGDAFAHWLGFWQSEQERRREAGDASPAPRPAVDWVASTIAETDLMMDALLSIGDRRLKVYRDHMRRVDTKLLPVSAEIPMIFCIIDEGAELLAYSGTDPVKRRAQQKVIKVMRTTRAAGIRLILTATDGNAASIGDTVVRKYSPVRIALTCTDSENAGVAKLFTRLRGIDSAQLRAKGAGVIGQAGGDGFNPTAFRTWETKPSMIDEIARLTHARRPLLDRPSVEAAGDVYVTRWDAARITWLTNPDDGYDGDDSEEETATIGHQEQQQRPVIPRDENGRPIIRRTLNLPSRGRPLGKEEKREQEPKKPVTDDDLARFLGQLEKLPETAEPAREPVAGTPAEPSDWKAAALRVVRDAGPDQWLTTGAVRAELESRGVIIGRPALSQALSEMARRGEISKRGAGPQTEYGANH